MKDALFTPLLTRWSLIHALLFYGVWFLAVSAVARPDGELTCLAVQATFVLICLTVVALRAGRVGLASELRWLAALGVLGFLVDGSFVAAGLLGFPFTGLYLLHYPWWLLLMWICFGTAFSSSLAWLHGPHPSSESGRYLSLQALFGALGGALSLYAAMRIGAVTFPHGLETTLAIVAVEWSIIMVFACRLHARITGLPKT